jgi:hypothetical protein
MACGPTLNAEQISLMSNHQLVLQAFKFVAVPVWSRNIRVYTKWQRVMQTLKT